MDEHRKIIGIEDEPVDGSTLIEILSRYKNGLRKSEGTGSCIYATEDDARAMNAAVPGIIVFPMNNVDRLVLAFPGATTPGEHDYTKMTSRDLLMYMATRAGVATEVEKIIDSIDVVYSRPLSTLVERDAPGTVRETPTSGRGKTS